MSIVLQEGRFYCHVKTGGIYKLLHLAYLEWNMQRAVVYQSGIGTVWVRPEAEFADGRFVEVSQ